MITRSFKQTSWQTRKFLKYSAVCLRVFATWYVCRHGESGDLFAYEP
ncbi:unnamed protein product, partial [Amoebophrya sp. A25]|eukprot:GSA25T00015743001.1